MESEIAKQFKDRLIESFLDVLILVELAKGPPLDGNDVISMVNNKFGTLLSSGMVYSVLYSMEREGLIASGSEGKRKVYLLTDQGKQTTKAISSVKQKILSLMSNLF